VKVLALSHGPSVGPGVFADAVREAGHELVERSVPLAGAGSEGADAVIVLGGGLSNIGRLYSRVPKLWAPFVFSDSSDTPLVAARHGDSSGVRGAAWLWPDS